MSETFELKKVFELLNELEDSQGTNTKKAKLHILLNEYPDAEEFIRLTYDKTIYGISNRSFEKICNYNSKVDGTYFDAGELVASKTDSLYLPLLKNFKEFLLELHIKSGDDKLKILKDILSFDKLSAKWCTRCIMKDLKIGISIKTINNILESLGKEKIPHFEVQLCDKFDDIRYVDLSEQIRNKVGYPCIVAIKYDGLRGFLQKQGNNLTFTSRNGEDIDYVPEIIESFRNIQHDFVLDGEILCDTFSEIQKRIGRKVENIEKIDSLHFRIFDILEFDGKDFSKEPQYRRSDFIRTIYDSVFGNNGTMSRLEEIKIVNSYETLKDFYLIAVTKGEEGVILKKFNEPYNFGERNAWFKIKPTEEHSFRIIDRKYGTGKKASVISSLYVEAGDIKTWVGSGLTDNDILHIMYLDKDKCLIGKIVDIAYNEITVDKFGNKSLRFPRFLKLRTDKIEPDNIK